MTTQATRILIVEDEPVVKLHLKSCLEQMGYQVLPPASTYQEALDVFKTHEPNLVLMDIVLEGELDGIDTAEKIIRDYGAPVVFLTAYSDDNTLARARVCQPHGYIVKPFKEEDLKSTIEMALFKSRQEKILKDYITFNTALIDSIEYPVLAVDCDENIIFMNARIPSLLGKPEMEIFGKGFDQTVKLFSENGDRMEIPYDRILVSGDAEHFDGVTLKCADGKTRLVDIAVSPFKKMPHRIIGAVLIFRDVTESTLSREEKSQTLESLIQLLEGQQEF